MAHRNRQPQTLHAAVLRLSGKPDVRRFEEVETHRPKPGYIVIKVLAAGVNRLDHYLREGLVLPNPPLPPILGVDAVGEVVELGKG
jgi:NADPH:quinone reductase